MARIIFISDTHGRRNFSVPHGDVLVHCGDLTMRGTDSETKVALKWIHELPHSVKLLIAGNHDFFFDPKAPPRFRDWSLRRHHSVDTMLAKYPSINYLFDSALTIMGFKFYGSPWQPWFYDWAFNVRRGPAIAEKWALIPDDVDVLITHGPPHGILDQNMLREFCGCEELRKVVERIEPKVHAFGHIHCAHGATRVRKTLFVNACIADEDYRATQSPITVDIIGGEAVVVPPNGPSDSSKERLREALSDVKRHESEQQGPHG